MILEVPPTAPRLGIHLSLLSPAFSGPLSGLLFWGITLLVQVQPSIPQPGPGPVGGWGQTTEPWAVLQRLPRLRPSQTQAQVIGAQEAIYTGD